MATATATATATAMPSTARAPSLDIFIGTLAVEQREVILTRCDLGSLRYLLRDDAKSHAVASYRRNARAAYAEVVGSYSEEAGRNILTVADFAEYTPEKNCHLTYGALDQAARGRWRIEKDQVVLVATLPDATSPLFSYVSTERWTAQAEQARRAQKRSEAEAVVRARCPGLSEPEIVATPVEIGTAACDLPTDRSVDGDAAKSGSDKLGIRIVDPSSMQPAHGVAVALRFADGRVDRIVTSRDGFALVSEAPSTPAVGVTLRVNAVPDVTLTFPPGRSGIVQVGMNMQQLTAQPFTTLRLRIVGTTLVSDIFTNGRYQRHP